MDVPGVGNREKLRTPSHPSTIPDPGNVIESVHDHYSMLILTRFAFDLNRLGRSIDLLTWEKVP